jgi:hypothetical protein
MMRSSHIGFAGLVFKLGFFQVGAAFLLIVSPVARPAAILFEATDLTDTTPGEDLWRYSYSVSGFTFATNQGFTIRFDRSLYRQLQSPPPLINADWDAISIQPDLALNSDGFYDAAALRNGPSLADPFTVSFVWLGTGAPAAQPFVISRHELLHARTRPDKPRAGRGGIDARRLRRARRRRAQAAPVTANLPRNMHWRSKPAATHRACPRHGRDGAHPTSIPHSAFHIPRSLIP